MGGRTLTACFEMALLLCTSDSSCVHAGGTSWIRGGCIRSIRSVNSRCRIRSLLRGLLCSLLRGLIRSLLGWRSASTAFRSCHPIFESVRNIRQNIQG